MQFGLNEWNPQLLVVSETARMSCLVAGDTNTLKPKCTTIFIADTRLVGHDSRLQGHPAFNGRVATLGEDLLKITAGQAVY